MDRFDYTRDVFLPLVSSYYFDSDHCLKECFALAFAKDNSTSAAYYKGKGDPGRFFSVIPAGSSGIRIEAYTIRWEDPVCFTRIHIASL